MGSQSHPGASVMTRCRIAAGYSTTEVASRLHRNQLTIQRWEAGQHSPSRALLEAMAGLYGVTPADLVEVH